MTYLDDKTHATLWKVLLVAAGCVAALLVPFVVVSQLTGGLNPDAPPPADQAGAGVATGGATVTAPASAPASSPSRATPASVGVPGHTPQPTAKTGSVDLAAATESCRLANLRLRAALGAADVSLAQFEKHIDAMNLLVAGKISYAVATQFWEETRVGATQNAAAFAAADRALRASRSTCPRLDPAVANALPYGPVVAVTTCASYVTAGDTAIARARTTVATWKHHIHDMEMLRMGRITPAQATAMWTKNWHTGQRQLHAYQSSERKAQKISCALD